MFGADLGVFNKVIDADLLLIVGSMGDLRLSTNYKRQSPLDWYRR
jgi:hypothetical protein